MAELDIPEIQRFESVLRNAGNAAIVTHMKPDGDAVGSTVAMFHFLKMVNPSCKASIVYSDPWPGHLDFIMDEQAAGNVTLHSNEPDKAESIMAESSLIICLDFNAFHRTDKLEKALS